MSSFGFIDIPAKELQLFLSAVALKMGVCKVLPRARFMIEANGPRYAGLVCHPNDMGGKATGIGAESCINCQREED